MPRSAHEAQAFGLRWHSDLPLDRFDPAPVDPAAMWGTVDVAANPEVALPARGLGERINRGWVYSDGVRFVWEREVAFDLIGGTHILYTHGPDWRGAMPPAFYSTVPALVLAWQGAIPLHACAVECHGKAVLIAGPAGAGKSTLAAGLIRTGARFVSDDLSAVTMADDGEARLWRGRPAIRLSAGMAETLDGRARMPIPDDPRGKWQIEPLLRTAQPSLPLAAILLLGGGGGASLPEHLFRPRWMALIPQQDARLRALAAIARSVALIDFPAIEALAAPDPAVRAAQAKTLIDRAFGS